MGADLFFAGKCYGAALRCFALREGSVRDRLKVAYQEAAFAASNSNDSKVMMSEDLALRIDAFHNCMTQRPSFDTEGTISASVDLMSDDELHHAGEELLGIAEELAVETALLTRAKPR